jgi:hypothetical protein
MENRFDSWRESFPLDRTAEFIRLHELGNPQIREVARIRGPIDHEDFCVAPRVESLDQVAADEPGATRHDYHCNFTSNSSQIAPQLPALL